MILPSIYFSSHQTFHFNCYYFSLFTQVSSFKWRPRYICTQTKFTGSLESSDRFCHLKIGSSWLAALHLISLMHSFRFCLVIAEKSQNLKDFLLSKICANINKIFKWRFGINMPTLCGQFIRDYLLCKVWNLQQHIMHKVVKMCWITSKSGNSWKHCTKVHFVHCNSQSLPWRALWRPSNTVQEQVWKD